jgi:3-mercaptopyruvate sulfurtransferase SseA
MTGFWREQSSMKSFLTEILGGIGIMFVAALIGVTVNAMRASGIPLIQQGEPVATVQHGESADTTATHAVAGAVSLADMKRIWDEGAAYIIDARDTSEYAEGHIPGAINVPYDRLPEYLDMLSSEVPMDGEVIVYCRGPSCDFSDQLATELRILGYQNVRVFTGGWEQWTAAGYPVDGVVPK